MSRATIYRKIHEFGIVTPRDKARGWALPGMPCHLPLTYGFRLMMR